MMRYETMRNRAVATSLVFVVSCAICVSQEPGDGPSSRLVRGGRPVQPSSLIPNSGMWQSSYDHTLDGELEARESPLVEISFHNGQLVGRYHDLRAVGKDNDSIFTGTIVDGAVAVITLRQDHRSGYTAIYTGSLVSRSRFVGTYRDNTGQAGDWSLELLVSDSTQTAPEEILDRSQSID